LFRRLINFGGGGRCPARRERRGEEKVRGNIA